ncbi:hypothetical protein [Streptomyces prunicolor]|uniref:hypothetical protein n=1 Tax=Streptomyces prunicolor TaxID=67348 RepID=UPI001319FC98|nr:hypothetical protein [Streptomyces prunicolor]
MISEADTVLAALFGAETAISMITGYADARPGIAADPHHVRLEIFSDERYAIASTRPAGQPTHRATTRPSGARVTTGRCPEYPKTLCRPPTAPT